jgi:hypothetical protein
MLTYRFQFRARPGVLMWVLEPVMQWWLERETRQRLQALAQFFRQARTQNL